VLSRTWTWTHSVSFSACFLSDLHCRKLFQVLGTMLVKVTVEINRHEECDYHVKRKWSLHPFLRHFQYDDLHDHFWEQMNLQDFTSVRDLELELLFAEILQFVSQLKDRFSQDIKRGERTEGIVIYICRSRRSWEGLETLQKTEIKGHNLHTSDNILHYCQIWAALVDL